VDKKISVGSVFFVGEKNDDEDKTKDYEDILLYFFATCFERGMGTGQVRGEIDGRVVCGANGYGTDQSGGGEG
jgi:hypothetical protein